MICAAVFEWKHFVNSARAQVFERWFGRRGMRIFCALMGCMLITLVVWAMVESAPPRPITIP